jgi:hypothetical protein
MAPSQFGVARHRSVAGASLSDTGAFIRGSLAAEVSAM